MADGLSFLQDEVAFFQEHSLYVDRLHDLLEKIKASSDIAELRDLLREAEVCFGLLPAECKVLTRSDALSSFVKFKVKKQAWDALKLAKFRMAESLETLELYDEAIPLYRSLVDLCFRARMEVGDIIGEVHAGMNNLGLCCKRAGRYEEALEWYCKGVELCKREAPGSPIQHDLENNIAVMFQDKAGPAISVGHGKKEWKMCWACGKKDGPTKKLLRCSKCFVLKHATPAFYCDRQCQIKDWPRHKFYHRSLKLAATASTCVIEDTPSENSDDLPPYDQLITEALACIREEDWVAARRKLEKAIKLDKTDPRAHHNLALIFLKSWNPAGAVREHLETIRCVENDRDNDADDGGNDSHHTQVDNTLWFWAESVVGIHDIYDRFGAELADTAKPTFLTDADEMLRVAKKATDITPESSEAWFMLAHAFELTNDLDQAATYYCRAAEIEQFDLRKSYCLEHADRVRRAM